MKPEPINQFLLSYLPLENKKLILIMILLFIPANQAFAQGFFDNVLPTDYFGWHMKLVSESFEEFFTFDKEKKIEVIQKHIDERDREHKALKVLDKPIPQQVLEIREQKMIQSEKLISELENQSEKTSLINSLKEKLVAQFSVADLKEIESDYLNLRHEDDPQLRIQKAREIDAKINNPVINVMCLGTLNSLDIANAQVPYNELQNQCTVLRIITFDEARNSLRDLG